MQCGISQGISSLVVWFKLEKTSGNSFPEAARLSQGWNYHLIRKKGWSGKTTHRSQFTSGTAEVYISPAFLIQIFMVKGSIIHPGTKALLFFSASLTHLPSPSLVAWIPNRKLFCIFMAFFLAVTLLGLGFVWTKVLFSSFFLHPLVEIIYVPLILSSALFLM